MMHDSRPGTTPARDLARRQMESVHNVHRMHVAIVSASDEVHLLEFEDADYERMVGQTIPAFVREISAHGTIVSSPSDAGGREGAIVTLMERSLETYYVPIVRITNADILVGDFRQTPLVEPKRFAPILDALIANWIEHDKH